MAFSIKDNPEIEILGTVGDKDPITYGGGFVCRRRDPYCTDEIDRRPWVEYCHGVEDCDDTEILENTFEVYRETVHADVCQYLSWADLAAVAQSCNTSVDELRSRGRSENVMDRVWAIETIAAHCGWHELDSYPLSLSIVELCERWGDDPADYLPEDDEDDNGNSPLLE